MPLRRRRDLYVDFGADGLTLVGGDGSSRAASRELLDVLALCDGARDAEAVAAALRWPGVSPAAARLLVEQTLAELEREGLVVAADEAPAESHYFLSYARPSVHRAFVTDPVRTEAYRRAIEAVVRAGDTVIEVGAGTGILSLFAARAGAEVVHAIEAAPIVALAEQVARDNGLAERVVFHHADATRIDLGLEADVLIADWVSHLVHREQIFAGVAAQRARALKPGGVILPARARLQLAPVCDPQARARGPEAWADPLYGFDLSALRAPDHAAPHTETRRIAPELLLAPPQDVKTFDAASLEPDALRAYESDEVVFALERDGVLDGVCGSFVSELAPGLELDTGPLAPTTFFQQEWLPLPPQEVARGDTLRLRLELRHEAGHEVLQLQGRLAGARGERTVHAVYRSGP